MQNYRKIVIIASPLIRKIKPNNGFSIFKLYKFMNKLNIISDRRLDELKNKYGSEDYRNANKVLKDTLVMAVNDDLSEILPQISSKVELIYGQEDLVVPVKVGIDSSIIIPDSQLTIIPDEGHNMLRSSAEKIIEIIKDEFSLHISFSFLTLSSCLNSIRWGRVAQREHYIPGYVTKFYFRWVRLVPFNNLYFFLLSSWLYYVYGHHTQHYYYQS